MSKVKRTVVNELHTPARVNFKRRRVIIKGLDDLHQADLVEMIPYAHQNKGFRYILIVIDAFSKFVWAEPVKNKSGVDVTKAMKTIFSKDHRIPKNLQTDLGKEFYNKDFKKLMREYNVHHYSTYSSKKASIVERVNRTLKSLMWREFSMQGTYKWLTLLREIVQHYNTQKHSVIQMKPIDVTKKNEKHILGSVYNHIKIVSNSSPKFNIGDHVRISKHRGAFTKGYTPNWSNEVFVVNQVRLTNPHTYTLSDKTGQSIQGGFYTHELQNAKYPDVYLVEKVLKRKGDMIYVKWLGFSNMHNSWIHKDNVE